MNDVVLMGITEDDLNWIKQKLCSAFKMRDLGLLHFCLGLEIYQRDGIFVAERCIKMTEIFVAETK